MPLTITKHMPIGDVVQRYPQTFTVFMRFGLHCVGCHVAAFETIEQGAMAHGINVDELVAELNREVSSWLVAGAAVKPAETAAKKPAKSAKKKTSKQKPTSKSKTKSSSKPKKAKPRK